MELGGLARRDGQHRRVAVIPTEMALMAMNGVLAVHVGTMNFALTTVNC